MRCFTTDKTYLRVRRWIDHDIANRYRAPSLTLSLMATIFIAFGFRLVGGGLSLAIWLALLLLSTAWTGFVLWRATRLIRTMSIRGDRKFDQQDKFQLLPEYVGSESVTAAAQRKRKSGRTGNLGRTA